MQEQKKNLLGLTQDELELFFLDLGHKKFRAKQLLQWMHQKYVLDFDLMSDFSKSLRDKLNLIASVSLPEIIS